MPKISVIMPVYNAEKYIKESIDCIFQQTFKDFELILIDDCGTDSSSEIIGRIEDPRIRIVRNSENKGIAFSRNKGIEVSNGEYIALMDDDDLTPPNRFEIQKSFLDSNAEIDVVGGRHQIIDENNRCLKVFPDPLSNPDYIKAYLMFRNAMANGTAMLRKQLIVDNKIRYQDGCYGIEDYLFWIDCSLKGRITNLSEVLLSWRQTSANATSNGLMNMTKQREEKYASLQRYALTENGFSLDENELSLFNRMFREKLNLIPVSKKDLEDIYFILCKIMNQADNMQLVNRNEIRIACKKLFSLRLENSEVWM